MGGLVPGFEYKIVMVDFLGVVDSMVEDIVLDNFLFPIGEERNNCGIVPQTFSKVIVV